MRGYLRTIDGKEQPVGPELPPVECFRCGICCEAYQPQLSPKEADKIAAGLGLSTPEFIGRYVQMTAIGYLVRRENEHCVFLTHDTTGLAACSIHRFRPDACRNWAASLERKECRDGLAKLKPGGKIILPDEVFPTPEAREGLYSVLENQNRKKEKQVYERDYWQNSKTRSRKV